MRQREGLPHGFGVLKRRPERSCGPCMIAVGARSVGTRGEAVVGVGNLAYETGVCVWSAVTLLDRVILGLGGG